MFALRFVILLLGLAVSAQCFIDHPRLDLPIKLGRGNRALQRKGINVFDVLKKLDICYMKCKENYCECCQKIKILFVKLEVCGTAGFTPAEKIAEVGLKASGLRLISTKVKLEQHLCRTIKSKIGPLELCVDSNIFQDERRPGSFSVCFKFQVSYEGIPSALLTFGCPDGNATINEEAGGEYHSVASLKVLNSDQVVKAIQKIVEKKN